MLKKKKGGLELNVRTFSGEDGSQYLVFRTAKGSYHAFVEVEAKQAARECGASDAEGNTRRMWESLWQQATD
jgi:hypothetical protein